MSKLDFSRMGASVNLGAPTPQAQRKAANIWLNVGVEVDMPTDDGGTEPVFISAFGVPVDVLDDVKPYTGKSDRMRLITAIKAQIVEAFKEEYASLEPGASIPVNGLKLELRRVGVAQAPAAADAEVLGGVSNLIRFG